MSDPRTEHGPTARLLLSAPDRPGLVAAVADFIYRIGGDVTQADQHNDEEEGMFFQRVEFRVDGVKLLARAAGRCPRQGGCAPPDVLERPLLRRRAPRRRARLRQSHCLVDLLGRWYAHELPGKPVLVISNHPDHAELVRRFGVAYHHLPVTKQTPLRQESALLGLLDGGRRGARGLARYMQILSPAVIDRYPARVINIHHSFLPAFSGGQPYHQAYARGVKLIGATAHYATAELDQGPIIDQDTARVSHRDGVARPGPHRARPGNRRAGPCCAPHLSDRVLVHGRKTIVF